MNRKITVEAASAAADQGFRALADLAAIAEGTEYRVIGGHMVQLLLYAYPTTGLTPRLTADADAGIDPQVAASGNLHARLLDLGYEDTVGNSYQRCVDDSDEVLSIDLLTVAEPGKKQVEQGGRMFDGAPGLLMALSHPAFILDVTVELYTGDSLSFTTQIPDVEPALILKALAWQSRMINRDLIDINNLLEIAAAHEASFTNPWCMNATQASKGTRLDAARALYKIVELNARNNLRGIPGISAPPRLAALIRKYVRDPESAGSDLPTPRRLGP